MMSLILPPFAMIMYLKIFEDSRSRLWIGTATGVDILDKRTNTFKHILDLNSDDFDNSSKYVNDIIEDKFGRIWLATGKGLFVYNSNLGVVKKQLIDIEEVQNENFTSLVFDDAGQLWIAGKGSGIISYNLNDEKFNYYNLPDNKYQNNIKCLEVDDENTLWIGNRTGGIMTYDINKKEFNQFTVNPNGSGLSSEEILEIREFYPGMIFICTDQGGINIYDKQTKSFSYVGANFHNAGNLSSDGIYSMYLDREDILWLGTSRGGVNYYNPKNYRFKNLVKSLKFDQNNGPLTNLTHDVVGTLLEASDGKIWIGTDGGGINVYNRETGFIEVYNTSNSNLSSNVIRSFSEDSNGDIWITTWSDDINKFITKEKKFIQIEYLADIQVGKVINYIWSGKV